MGETIRIRAIVLNKTDYRDSDRIVTLFSPEIGKLTASVKGVKKQTARNRAASEVFSFGTFLLAQSRGRYTVTGFDGIDSFHELREDFDRLAVASLFLRVTEQSIEEDQPAPELFSLLLRSLDKLRQRDIPASLTVSVFLMRLACLLGYAPVLDGCVQCGKQEELVFLSPEKGGVVCASCEGGEHKAISGGCLFYLRKLCTEDFDDAFRLRPSQQQLHELYHVCCYYISYFFDRKFKIMDYIEKYGIL